MSVQEKMTALADQVRLLSGNMIRMGLDDLAQQTREVNTQVLEQTDLIGRIYQALQNVSGGTGTVFTSWSKGHLPVVFYGSASTGLEICRESAAYEIVN